MKIVHWDEMFHPSFGYQINVLPVYQRKMGHEVIILTSKKIESHPVFSSFANKIDIEKADRDFENRTGVKIIRLPIFGVYSGRVIYKPGIIKQINKLKPDIIMCHTSDTLSSIIITVLHKFVKSPIVFDNHMLEMASVNRFSAIFRKCYKLFISPIIKKNKFVTIRTQDDPYVIDCLGIPDYLAPYISFGTDTDMFSPNDLVRKELREEFSIGHDDFVIMYCGKLTNGKGANILADAIEKKIESDREIIFMIIGNTSDDVYGREIENKLSNSENRIIRFGTQTYYDLSKYYQIADVAIFPKQCSLSFFDVQAVGLPVILEDNKVNKGRINGNGLIFENGSSSDLRNAIVNLINMPPNEFDNMRIKSIKYIKDNFDYNEISKKYTEILLREKNRQTMKSEEY